MMSDFNTLDVMVGSDKINPIERKVASAIEESSVQYDKESNLPAREDFPHENEFKNQNYGNIIPRHGGILESLETFTKEVNLRLSQEMDSIMSMVNAQINRAISSAISDRVILEKKKYRELKCLTIPKNSWWFPRPLRKLSAVPHD